jgi:uncharacterized protein
MHVALTLTPADVFGLLCESDWHPRDELWWGPPWSTLKGFVVQSPEPDCWLHPEVEVMASPIEGRGLFARSTIPAGTVVSRLGGRLVNSEQLRAMFAVPDHPYIDTITVDEELHLVLPPRRANGYGNHSCDPNLWWVDAYTLAARRDIAGGEELTNDYAACTADPQFRMPCTCGSPQCRGEVIGGDWQRTDLQQRYADHWVPAINSMIATVLRP